MSEGPLYPELVIGLVAPSGTKRDRLTGAIADRLSYYQYDVEVVRISRYLEDVADLSTADQRRPDKRTPTLQKVGDLIRTHAQRADALGFVAAGLIREARVERNRQSSRIDQSDESAVANSQVGGLAYIVWSLKHPDEVAALRGIYGSRFSLISSYAPKERRVRWLADDISQARRRSAMKDEDENSARDIVNRDDYEPSRFGQNVRATYPLADFFIDATDDVSLKETVDRAVDILFGAPFETPTRDEYGMYIAYAAALRSAEMGRQVGACLLSHDGRVLAAGTNEVPTVGGGHFWRDQPTGPGLMRDNREFRSGADSSDKTKRTLATEVFDAFAKSGWVIESADPSDNEIYEALDQTGLREITEYGRAVHAELSCLTDALRTGVSTIGATMYVTTFPCHNCARHVVAAGVERLVYVDPYPKSRAIDMHGDVIDAPGTPTYDYERVVFDSFLGVAPRRYIQAFAMRRRKNADGTALPVDDPRRVPLIPDETPYGDLEVVAHILRERQAVSSSEEWLPEAERKAQEEDGNGKDTGNAAPAS